MPYNSVVSRSDVAALIPEDVAAEVISGMVTESASLSLFRRVNMSSAQQRIPVLSALPTAYWVTGDTGLKQTTEMAWSNKFLNVEELAAIVPIPENVLEDTTFDVWGEVRPRLQEAIGRALDAAIFFGVNAPASFPDDVNTAAAAAANDVTIGSAAGSGGIQNDLDLTIEKLEADGFDPTGYVADRSMKGRFRRARNTQGDRLDGFNEGLDEYLGDRVIYAMPGLWPTGAAVPRLFTGDWTQFVVGVRRDISYKMLSEAVIQDNTGAIVYNLAQQDMVALRVTFRAGWQVANPITQQQPTEANRYPAAVLLQP